MYLDKGRQPVGVHTLTQLIIVASAVLVVGGIIALTAISSFGETTDGKNWFAKFSQDKEQSKSSATAIEEATQFTDEELIETMKMVQDLVVQYHRITGYLPSVTGHLSKVTQSIPFEYSTSGNQEPTIDGVHYEHRGGDLFDLCAYFTGSNKGMLTGAEVQWEHKAGRVCLRRDIRKVLSPVPPSQSSGTSTAPMPQSSTGNQGVSMEDFFKNTDTCTISSFSSKESGGFSPNLAQTLGIVHRLWMGKILGIRGTECIVELGYADFNASDVPQRSAELECRANKNVFLTAGTNRTIGSVLTEKITYQSAIDLVAAVDVTLKDSRLDEDTKVKLQVVKSEFSRIRTKDYPGVTCAVVGSAF